MKIKHLVPVKRPDPFLSLGKDFEQVFGNFFGGAPVSFLENEEFSPSVSVVEEEKALKVSAELPGVEEKDVEVSLHDGVLTIRGEKKSDSAEKGKDFYRSERVYGSFSRSIPLPSDVDADKADANYRKGVLTVTLPKSALNRKQTIKVKSE